MPILALLYRWIARLSCLVKARGLCSGQLGQRQPNNFDTTERFRYILPERFSTGQRRGPQFGLCVCICVGIGISVCDSWGETEVIRWRSCSFVPIIYTCCRRHTLEYACRVFYVFAFFDGVCAVHWLRWSFPVDERI